MPEDVGYTHGGEIDQDADVEQLVSALVEVLSERFAEGGQASGVRRLENVQAEQRRSFAEGGQTGPPGFGQQVEPNREIPQQVLGKLSQATRQGPSAFSKLVEVIKKIIARQTQSDFIHTTPSRQTATRG